MFSRSPESSPGGVPTRRSVIAAAWTLPAIALTTAVPALATSGPAVVFSAATAEALRCATIGTLSLSVTPAAVEVVTLALSDGYSFDGGATSTTVTTSAAGAASVPDVHVPATGAAGTLSATTSRGARATVALTATADTATVAIPGGRIASTSNVPAGAVPVAGGVFFSSGVLYRATGEILATGVDSYGRLAPSPSDPVTWLLPFIGTDAVARTVDPTAGTVTVAAGVPAAATPLASDLFRVGSVVYRGSSALASDLDISGQLVELDQGAGSTGVLYLPYRSTSGSAKLLRLPAADSVAATVSTGSVPSGAVPVAGDLFFSNGSLWRVSPDGTHPYGTGVVATSLATWGALAANPSFLGERVLPVQTTSGVASIFMVSGNAVRAARAVPDGATPIGADVFLSGGVLYRDGVGAVASGVASVGEPVAAASASTSSASLLPFLRTTVPC